MRNKICEEFLTAFLDLCEQIFKAKNRPNDNPLIVHVSDRAMLDTLVSEVPEDAKKLMDAFWPGALTLLLPKKSIVPETVTCGQPTVAIRMPSHPIAHKLIHLSQRPIAAPSANLSGRPSPTTAQHVLHDLDGRLECILDGGACEVGLESTVVDVNRRYALKSQSIRKKMIVLSILPCHLTGVFNQETRYNEGKLKMRFSKKRKKILRKRELNLTKTNLIFNPPFSLFHFFKSIFLENSPPLILRPGGVTLEQLRTVLPSIQVYSKQGGLDLEEKPPTPGLKYRHYSPTASLTLYEGDYTAIRSRMTQDATALAQNGKKVGIIQTSSLPLPSELKQLYTIQLGENSPLEVAKGLFAALRSFDDQKVDVILMEGISEKDEGLAVMNRARKAASQVVSL